MNKLLRIVMALICLSPIQAFAMEKPSTSNMLARSYNRVHSLVANHKVAATVLSAATLGAAYYAYKNWPNQNSLSTLDENKEKFYPKDFENLFAKLGIRYLDHLEFEDSVKQLKFVFRLPNAHSNSINELSDETVEHCIKFLEKKYQASVCIQFIKDNVGYGVFALEDIAKGQFIGEYTGIVEKSTSNKDYAFLYYRAFSEIEGYNTDLDAQHAGNFTRFINHSYNPNVDVEAIFWNNTIHYVFIANKPIKKGNQLFINYGMGYWMGRGIQPQELNPIFFKK